MKSLIYSIKDSFFLVFFVFVISPTILFSQTNHWSQPTAKKKISRSEIIPDLPEFEKGFLVQLDLQGFINQSGTAGKERRNNNINSSVIVLLPLPDGTFERFRLLESSMMEPGLEEVFPNVKSYLIKGVDRPLAAGRLTVSPEGFTAYISSLSDNLEYYIRRTSKIDPSQYMVFYAKDNPLDKDPIECQWEGKFDKKKAKENDQMRMMPGANDTGDELRIFRLAMTLPGDLSEYYGWQTKMEAMTALLGVLGSINAIYERDLSVRFVLPVNQEKIIFLDEDTDPFTVHGGYEMANENKLVQGELIGDENFDIGLVFVMGGCCAANNPSICTPNKAINISRFWGVTVTAHEIGHQFGSNVVNLRLNDPSFGYRKF